VRVGIANIDVATAGGWDRTEPVRVGGHEATEVGVVSSAPPREVWLQSYLSLNRDDLRLTVPRVDQQSQVKLAPFVGARSSDWRPPVTDDIVIDDLDAGFSVESDGEASGMRLAGGLGIFVAAPELDQGLPEFTAVIQNASPGEWSRLAAPLGWGKYRRTVAAVGSGSGTRRAIFTARLPHAGRWRLAYHLPAGVLTALGRYDLTLHANGETRVIEFDGAKSGCQPLVADDGGVESISLQQRSSDDCSARTQRRIRRADRGGTARVTNRNAEIPENSQKYNEPRGLQYRS
jgi:hypothetical protein